MDLNFKEEVILSFVLLAIAIPVIIFMLVRNLR